MSDPAPKVAIVEDHALLSEALAAALRIQGFPDVGTVDVTGLDDPAVVRAVAELDAQVVLLDVNLGDGRLGLSLIPDLVGQGRTVLMLTASREASVLGRCLQAGAAGVFDKAQPFDDLVSYIHDAAMGFTVMSASARDALLADVRAEQEKAVRVADLRQPFEQLTAREAEVLRLIIDGHSALQIAERQHVSEATVRTHIRAVLTKLGVSSQLAAAALARRAAWPPDG